VYTASIAKDKSHAKLLALERSSESDTNKSLTLARNPQYISYLRLPIQIYMQTCNYNMSLIGPLIILSRILSSSMEIIVVFLRVKLNCYRGSSAIYTWVASRLQCCSLLSCLGYNNYDLESIFRNIRRVIEYYLALGGLCVEIVHWYILYGLLSC